VLREWDTRVWDAAWVNRIALFLRAWSAHESDKASSDLFGVLPAPKIDVTHDVDAVAKTLPIRIKQGGFNFVNAVRYALKGEVKSAADKFTLAIRFCLGNEDWWTFDKLLDAERQAGIAAQFNFYTDERRKTLKNWLFDPGYTVESPRIKGLCKKIVRQQGTVGLHPTFDAWQDGKLIREQRERLSDITGINVTACRQHWLRFGWGKTWTAQEEAGIKRDSTLMFNDRPGFRAAAALEWQPWDTVGVQRHSLAVLPTVIMDSHYYDYRPMNAKARCDDINYWVNECKLVGGEIAVLWHPHTLTKDYGWLPGFNDLLAALTENIGCTD